MEQHPLQYYQYQGPTNEILRSQSVFKPYYDSHLLKYPYNRPPHLSRSSYPLLGGLALLAIGSMVGLALSLLEARRQRDDLQNQINMTNLRLGDLDRRLDSACKNGDQVLKSIRSVFLRLLSPMDIGVGPMGRQGNPLGFINELLTSLPTNICP